MNMNQKNEPPLCKYCMREIKGGCYCRDCWRTFEDDRARGHGDDEYDEAETE